ncbi:glycosyltransferase family 4 protein [Nocardioides sp.]|uniref:glycosyltransferase family 4 protein n=1 Tax=Nocardioides sp. TaxID=35761 RepID=UPI0037844EC7
MSFRVQARRAARKHAARASAVVPADRGPEWWQATVGRAHAAEAHRRLVADRDPDGALALVTPLLDGAAAGSPAGSRAWAVAAEVHERTGTTTDALAAARAAVATEPTFAARLVHARVALACGDPEEAAVAVAALVDTRPRNKASVLAVLAVLRQAGHDDVRRFRANLLAWDLPGYDEDVLAVHAELDLVEAAPEELATRLDQVTNQLRRPLLVVARALDRRRDWEVLADYADRRIAGGSRVAQRRAVALELRRAASRALAAGHAGAAKRLAGQALARHPDDRYARETWLKAADDLAVVRDGWTAPAVVGHGFDPRPRTVLAALAQSLPHRSGGYATRSHGFLTGLQGLGWDVEAVTRLGFPYDRWSRSDPRRVAAYDDVDGVCYHRVLATQEPGPYPQHPLTAYVDRYAAALTQHARRHRPALLHASSFHVNGLATRAAAARLGLPYVYEMRGLEDLMKVSRDPGFAGSDRDRFLDTVELASCAGAARVLVITEALRREMAARGVPEDKLVVLPNGVHTHLFEPRPRDAELEEALGLRGTTVIGYAGSLVDYEGLELLLEAVAALAARRSDFRLLVVGDGPHEAAVRATVDRLGLQRVVVLTGRVPHEEVGRYLSLVDVAPFPRLPLPVCELISPIKPFESMAMGKAVVVSSVAALTEIVADGTTGLVFEKGSAAGLARTLERLLDEPDLRAKLGESARTWVRNERDWSSLVEGLASTYEEVLA